MRQAYEDIENGILDKEFYENEKNVDINEILCVHLDQSMIMSFN